MNEGILVIPSFFCMFIIDIPSFFCKNIVKIRCDFCETLVFLYKYTYNNIRKQTLFEVIYEVFKEKNR